MMNRGLQTEKRRKTAEERLEEVKDTASAWAVRIASRCQQLAAIDTIPAELLRLKFADIARDMDVFLEEINEA